MLPLLKDAAAAATNGDDSKNIKRSAIINMSSTLGSIAENSNGGLYPYRSSKVSEELKGVINILTRQIIQAALNAITKSMSVDLNHNGILVVSLHPGWVQTDMGGKNAPLSPEQSISSIINTLENLNESNQGHFYQYDGETLPW